MASDLTNRSTEGSRPGKRGRPLGSLNKNKSIIPREAGQKLMENMKEQLSDDQFAYLKGVVKDGKPIQTKSEIDMLIALLTRNLLPAIVQEMIPVEEGGLGGIYRKDVTDRLKIVMSLLNTRHQIDKNDDTELDQSDTILKISAKRGFNLDRLGILVSERTVSVGGNVDGIARSADDTGTVSDQIPERPLLIQSGEQGETDRVLDGAEHRDFTLSRDTTRLQE